MIIIFINIYINIDIKKDDKTIGENNAKMEKLATKIKEAKGDKKDKLIAEYNALADSNKKLQQAINSAGGKEIIKGDGSTKITLNNCDKADTAHYVDNNTNQGAPQNKPQVSTTTVQTQPQTDTPVTSDQTPAPQNSNNLSNNFNFGLNQNSQNSNGFNLNGINQNSLNLNSFNTTKMSLEIMRPGIYRSSSGLFKIAQIGSQKIVQDMNGKVILDQAELQKLLQNAQLIKED